MVDIAFAPAFADILDDHGAITGLGGHAQLRRRATAQSRQGEPRADGGHEAQRGITLFPVASSSA